MGQGKRRGWDTNMENILMGKKVGGEGEGRQGQVIKSKNVVYMTIIIVKQKLDW